jgi:hypothetical protein
MVRPPFKLNSIAFVARLVWPVAFTPAYTFCGSIWNENADGQYSSIINRMPFHHTVLLCLDHSKERGKEKRDNE